MGHTQTLQQGIYSTASPDPSTNKIPTNRAHRPLQQKYNVGAHTINFTERNGTIATHLPSRFSITSARDNKYIFVLYDYDSNMIIAAPIRDRKKILP